MKKVGLPRALLYYKFSELWITFFKVLGTEVIISPLTNKSIKENSIRIAPNEDCFSTKLYYGHVMFLKDKVDYLFIPRFGSKHKTNSGCPKFIGLSDVLKSMFPDLPEIINPYYSTAKAGHGKFHLFKLAFKIGLIFTKNPFRILHAISTAIISYKEHQKQIHLSEETLSNWENSNLILNPKLTNHKEEQPLKIALAAHSYILNDQIASLEIVKKLELLGIDIITSEQMPISIIEEQMNNLEFNLFFDFEREILGTIMYFLEQKTIDGIIHIIIFSCGPDSIAGEMAAYFSMENYPMHFLQLTFDELTGDAGLMTRLEAFVDMIRMEKRPIKAKMPVNII